MATTSDQGPTTGAEPRPEKGSGTAATSAPVVIKKYANRRLYNTATSGYVTLDNLAQMVREGTDFVVYDARTGEDITRSVLTQIIVEEEGKGRGLLPIDFLRHLIRLYGDSLQTFVPGYLDMSMEALSRNQEQIRNYMAETLGAKSPLEQFEGLARQNMAFFERAMRMFSPFGATAESGRRTTEGMAEPSSQSVPSDHRSSELEELKQQISAMQRQINSLANRG